MRPEVDGGRFWLIDASWIGTANILRSDLGAPDVEHKLILPDSTDLPYPTSDPQSGPWI